MLALAIFGIVAIASLRSISTSLTVASRAKDVQTAVILAQARASELLASPENVEEGEGEFETPYTAYRWRLRFTDSVHDETEGVTFLIGRLAVEGPSGAFEMVIPLVKEEEHEGT